MRRVWRTLWPVSLSMPVGAALGAVAVHNMRKREIASVAANADYWFRKYEQAAFGRAGPATDRPRRRAEVAHLDSNLRALASQRQQRPLTRRWTTKGCH